MIKIRKHIKKSALIIVVLLFQSSVFTKNKNGFECSEYYLPEIINWQTAYNNVKYCSEAMLLKNEDKWAIIYPGSLRLIDDTIYINQEAGYPNTCIYIGEILKGDTIPLPNNNFLMLTEDSILKYNQIKYLKVDIKVEDGCWCDWK